MIPPGTEVHHCESERSSWENKFCKKYSNANKLLSKTRRAELACVITLFAYYRGEETDVPSLNTIEKQTENIASMWTSSMEVAVQRIVEIPLSSPYPFSDNDKMQFTVTTADIQANIDLKFEQIHQKNEKFNFLQMLLYPFKKAQDHG